MKLDENVRQLIADQYFVKWVIDPDHESEAFWKAWMECDPARIGYSKEAKNVIIGQVIHDKIELSPSKRQAIWDTIQSQINPAEVRPVYRYSKVMRYGIAAAVAVVMIATLEFFIGFRSVYDTPKSVFQETVVPVGTKVTLQLEDGTRINLNAGSRIRYPEKFSSGMREVFLEGEAFFHVERDAHRPFIVHSKNIQVTVLGTAFNVNAYTDNNQIDVAVATGKVAVLDTEKKEQAIQLVGAQRATYMKKNRQMVRTNFDVATIAPWTDGIITFNDAGFEEIEKTLERWYGVEIIVESMPIVENDFNGSFDNESLETVLKGLGFSLNFNYVIKDKTVVITAYP